MYPHYSRIYRPLLIPRIYISRFNQGKASNIYFWQSKDRKEIDIVTDNQEVYEIKTSQTRQPQLSIPIAHPKVMDLHGRYQEYGFIRLLSSIQSWYVSNRCSHLSLRQERQHLVFGGSTLQRQGHTFQKNCN